MTTPAEEDLPSLPDRNDVAGAVAYAVAYLDADRWTPDRAQRLLMLQDDDAELLGALRKLWDARERAGLPTPPW